MARAILLDWNNTLSVSKFWEHWIEDPLHRDHYTQICNLLGHEKLADQVYEWERGGMTSEDVIALVAKKLKLDFDDVLGSLKLSSKRSKLIEPEILDYVKKAKRLGYMVGIATDNMDTFTRWTAPALKLEDHFDVLLNSADIGATKFDLHRDGTLKFFRQFMAEYNLKPRDIILIDDCQKLEQVVKPAGIDFRRVTTNTTAAAHLERVLAHSLVY